MVIFDTADKERPGNPKEIEDEELKTLFDEDPCQTRDELADSLRLDRSTISRHVHALVMI